MLTLAQFGKWFIPGSPCLLLVVVTAGVVLLFARAARIRAVGRLLLAAVAGCYWLLSLPAVAEALQCGIPPMRLPVVDSSRGDLAIVVLGSGVNTYHADGRNISTPAPQSAFNIIEGSRLFKVLGNPPVIVTGGIADASMQREREADVLAPILQAHGVPPDRIILERRANTTHTQAIEVAIIAKAHGFKRLIVVTSPAHLRRAVPAFVAQGVDAVGSPAPFASERRIKLSRWTPSLLASETSYDAIYDYFGWAYYLVRGWLTPPVTQVPRASALRRPSVRPPSGATCTFRGRGLGQTDDLAAPRLEGGGGPRFLFNLLETTSPAVAITPDFSLAQRLHRANRDTASNQLRRLASAGAYDSEPKSRDAARAPTRARHDAVSHVISAPPPPFAGRPHT